MQKALWNTQGAWIFSLTLKYSVMCSQKGKQNVPFRRSVSIQGEHEQPGHKQEALMNGEGLKQVMGWRRNGEISVQAEIIILTQPTQK